MLIKKTFFIACVVTSSIILLSGCSNSQKYQLTESAKRVQFIDTKPDEACQFIAKAEGSRDALFAGTKTHSELIKDAAADLRNNAARMGGNRIYNAEDSTIKYVSELIPTDVKMVGQVYKCDE